MNATYLCLVFLANFCLSTLAAPLSDEVTNDELEEDFTKRDVDISSKRGVSYGTALGHKSKSNDYASDREAAFKKIFGGKREVASDVKRGDPFTFGTGMGYNSNKKGSDYMNDWQNAYNTLYSKKQNGKRAPAFTFGTALGHNQGGEGGDYANSMNAKFHELFGKRDEVDDDVIARWEAEQD